MLALAAASGAGALALETTWLRWFRLLFGATAPAAAATLVAFFLGQALGALAAARLAPGWRRPLAAFGALALAAALACLAVPGLLRGLEPLQRGLYDALSERPAALTALRFAIALAATLGASTLLGATLPALAHAWLTRAPELATRGTALYAANLLGAALGAALAAFVLPERIGVLRTHLAGIALLAAPGAVALALGLRQQGREPVAAATATSEAAAAQPVLSARALALLAAFSGFGSFALQVLVVRALALVLDQSVYAFGAVLVVVLAALALGSLGVGLLCGRLARPPGAVAAWACALAGVGAAAFPALLNARSHGLDFAAPGAGGTAALVPALRLAATTAGPALLAAGALLPAVFAAAGAGRAALPGPLLGRLLAANTAGAIAGALCAPFALLAWLTPWSACAAIGAAYAGVAALLPMPSRGARLARDVGLALGWISVVRLANPLALPLVRLAPGEALVHAVSGPAGLVAVVARGDDLLIRTDNHQSLAGTADRVHQERQGLLAHLLHPGARRVAWIGSATGISAGPLAQAPLEELALVEITPGVSEAAAAYFHDANRGVHVHPSARVVQDDARNFARATAARYDLIVGDLFVPWISGTGSLYAREHFRAVRARLEANGLFVQWLPLYQLDEASFASVVATFLDAFPRAALWRGDFFGRFPIVALVGCTGRAPEPEAIARAASALAARGESDRWVTDPVAVFALYAGPLAPLRAALADVPRNTDDEPVVELASARSGLAAGASAGESAAFVGARLVRLARLLREGATRDGDDFFPALPEAARRAAEAGELLQAASVAFVAGRSEAAARLLAGAAERLPAALLDPARPDPTAAELWPQ